MLNIANLNVKPYCFMDGTKVIECISPSNSTYATLRMFSQDNYNVDKVLDLILKEEDKHYIEELDETVKSIIAIDYFKFHTEQLEARFPDSVTD